jgi:hypothetical protein
MSALSSTWLPLSGCQAGYAMSASNARGSILLLLFGRAALACGNVARLGGEAHHALAVPDESFG